ncbi:MAG: L-histidine N(alpha)-methyltransferase [Deltaproteobacteria bacterium]|nr:L-histidine N(alpha)-methyltransferase [Deltaproteobacteria bacterium]
MSTSIKPQAFVVMPFSKEYEKIYVCIKKVLNKSGINPIRADEIQQSTPFIEDIENNIRSCDLVIVDASEENLNVYYELGLASALKKDLIILSQNAKHIPSDTRHIRHLVYDSSDLVSLEKNLKGWVEKTRAYVLKASRESYKVLNRGEIFTNITDATLYLDSSAVESKEVIRKSIAQRVPISTKWIYSTERGAELWLRLCGDADYQYYTDSIDFFTNNTNKILDIIGDEIVVNSPDYISVGCGNGTKDKIFLNALLSKQNNPREDMFYYPLDISTKLIAHSIINITSVPSIKNRLKIKAINADFYNLRSFMPVYQYRPEPNIITMLGNTLGNLKDDMSFVSLMKEAMMPGDIFIVEVRLKTTDEAKPGGNIELNKQFDFTPLYELGVHYDSDKLDYVVEKNKNQVSGTKTITAIYKGLEINEEVIRRAKLSFTHEYDKESLIEAISDEGLTILDTLTYKSTIVVITKKPTQSGS